ncbi:uncharacterized protein LOC122301120 [Carya illinoinensis]|uniref:Uncharacterized protein n=1 Tax=Carya illinoinensis TaxID=32201 RepID=A0A8T1REA9_CARIL|nr:uncharacterized protein LOC122301120 [Carya illinoinensis]KAG6665358.1 hypothetical protein CIPAW_02G156300 [Carya illinoinensis]
MSSISQGLVLATAMFISSTALFLAYCRQKSFTPTQLSETQNSQQPDKQIVLRSCLYSDKKMKKVQFAENAKDPRGNGEECRKEHMKRSKVEMGCRSELRRMSGMPENRVALYNGILKERVQKMQCSC